jgi:hypothetical protein
MKDHIKTNEEAAILAGQEHCAVPPLRDVLKRQHDEAQGRPRNEALEKWGPGIEAEIEREMARRRRLEKPLPPLFPSPAPAMPREKAGPDMDR